MYLALQVIEIFSNCQNNKVDHSTDTKAGGNIPPGTIDCALIGTNRTILKSTDGQSKFDLRES